MTNQPKKEEEKKTEAACYGRELWDCLPVLERNTRERTMQMRSLKELVEQIRIGLETFQMKISSSVKAFKQE